VSGSKNFSQDLIDHCAPRRISCVPKDKALRYLTHFA
jgi:hypothetical protein